MFITNKNAIVESINKGVVEYIEVSNKDNHRNRDIISLAISKGVQIKYVSKEGNKYHSNNKTGLIACVKDNEQKRNLTSLLSYSLKQKKNPMIFILDGITDVNNFGAIIRNAYFFGIDAIIVPKNNSASMNERVYEISSGAAHHIPVFTETNISKTMDYLKESGFWIYYASEKGDTNLENIKFDTPMAVILGNEHSGVRPLLQKHSDGSICIGSPTGFDSLNVSAATAVIAYAYSIFQSN